MNIDRGMPTPRFDRSDVPARDPERQPIAVEIKDTPSERDFSNMTIEEIRDELRVILGKIEALEERKPGLVIGLRAAWEKVLKVTLAFDEAQDLIKRIGEITSQTKD